MQATRSLTIHVYCTIYRILRLARAAAGAAALRGVVEKMGEFLGAAHQDTVKWRAVLSAM